MSHRPTRGIISSYNIAGLISEVSEEVATQIATTPLSFEALAERNRHEYPHTPYPETRVIGLHFCR